MNMAELTSKLAEEQKLSRKRAKALLDAAFAAIAERMAAGEEVVIPGFGRFKMAHHEAGQRQNPETGEVTKVPAGRRPVFAAARQVREKLNEATSG